MDYHPPAKNTSTPARLRPKRRRLWVFRFLVLTIVPAAFFLLFEFSLRLFGFGYPTSFTLKTEVNDQIVHVDNSRFSWRFFAKQIARSPIAFTIPEVKAKNTCRIFVFGGSAARGTPDHSFSFGRILEVFLRHHFPGVDFELVNASMAAINSHVVLEIARDCTKLDPDLFIVYMGNNEVVGPFGAGTVFAPLSSNLSLIRASLLVKSTRIGQLMTELFGTKTDASSLRRWKGMSMFLQKQVPHDAPSLRIVYEHFRENLSELCQLAKKSNTPTAVCTVATNLKDCAPFASLHRPDLAGDERKKWEGMYQKAVDFESHSDFSRAVELLLQAAEVDDHYAELHYRLGRCFWSLQEYQKAHKSFVQARELDTLRFRADTQINKSIRAAVSGEQAQGIYLVDIERSLAEHSPHTTPGGEFFHEHVHLKFNGNFLLAQTVYHRIEKLLPKWIRNQAAQNIPALTEGECAKRLAYTHWDDLRIIEEMLWDFIKKPPFANQLNNSEQAARMENHLAHLRGHSTPETINKVDGQYRQAIQNRKRDVWIRHNYAGFLESVSDFKAAEQQRRFVVDALPHCSLATALLGRTLRNLGRLNEARAFFEKAVQSSPENVQFHSDLAMTLARQGKFDEAIERFRKTIRLDPENSPLRVDLAITLAQFGKEDGATGEFQRAIELEPDNAEAHYNFAVAQSRWGQTEEAIHEYREAIRIKPGHAKARTNLGELYGRLGRGLVQQGRYDEAIERFQETIQLDPENSQLRLNLAITLALFGNEDEASREFRQAITLEPDNPEARYSFAVAQSRWGHLEEAVHEFLEAIRIRPDDAKAHTNLGDVYGRLGRYQEALEACKEATRIEPDYPEALYHLGIAYFEVGDIESALKSLERLRKLDRNLADRLSNFVAGKRVERGQKK